MSATASRPLSTKTTVPIHALRLKIVRSSSRLPDIQPHVLHATVAMWPQEHPPPQEKVLGHPRCEWQLVSSAALPESGRVAAVQEGVKRRARRSAGHRAGLRRVRNAYGRCADCSGPGCRVAAHFPWLGKSVVVADPTGAAVVERRAAIETARRSDRATNDEPGPSRTRTLRARQRHVWPVGTAWIPFSSEPAHGRTSPPQRRPGGLSSQRRSCNPPMPLAQQPCAAAVLVPPPEPCRRPPS